MIFFIILKVLSNKTKLIFASYGHFKQCYNHLLYQLLPGLLGDATEDIVEHLDKNNGKQWACYLYYFVHFY